MGGELPSRIVVVLFESYVCVRVCVNNMTKRTRCVPFWNMCHPETCFRLAWCAGLKNVHFWNMFQIGTMQTSSYRSRMLNARSFSIQLCAKRLKVKQSCICLFVGWLVCFSVINVGLLHMQWVKKTYCCLSLHGVNLKYVSEMHIFQNGTPCQSEICFRKAQVSERLHRLIREFAISTLYRKLQKNIIGLYSGMSHSRVVLNGFRVKSQTLCYRFRLIYDINSTWS